MKHSAFQNDPAQLVAGFPCPRCKGLIRFSFPTLLTQPAINCSQCGLELQIDLGCSAAALEDLRQYVAGLEDAERILEESMPG